LFVPFSPHSIAIEMLPLPLPLPQQVQERQAHDRARDLWNSMRQV